MTEQQKLHALEQTVGTLSRALHITAERTNWLMRQAAQTASPKEMDALERIELECILDTAEAGNAVDAPIARRVLDALGVTIPDFVPANLAIDE